MSRLVSFIVLVGILILIALLFYQVMAGFLVPLFLAALLGVVFQPWYKAVLRYVRRLSTATLPIPAKYRPTVSRYLAAAERYLAAGATTIIVLVAVLAPAGVIVTMASIQGLALIDRLQLADVRVKADELRRTLGLEIPIHGDLIRIEATLKHWREQLRYGKTAEFNEELIGNLERRVNDIEAWRTSLGEAAPLANPEPLRDQFVILRNSLPDTRDADEAMRGADADFKVYKRDLLGGAWLALVKEFVNPTDQQLDDIRRQVLGSLGSPILNLGGDTLKVVAKLIFGIVIIVAALFFMFAEGAWMLDAALRLSPLEEHYVRELIEEFDRVCRAVVLATLLSAFAQAVLAFIGFYFAGLHESVALLALLTFVLAMVPFTGAFTVWGPVCLYLYFVNGDVYTAIGLALYGTFIISFADNIIKPLVLSGQSNLHPLAALLSVLGGIQALGPVGILIGPMVVVFLQTLLKLLQRELMSLDRLTGAINTKRRTVDDPPVDPDAPDSDDSPTPENNHSAPADPPPADPPPTSPSPKTPPPPKNKPKRKK